MNIPRELVEHFTKGNGAIFVGAGLSIGAGLPGWGDLVSRLAAEIEGCPTDVSYQDIAQYYVIEYGLHRLVTRLREELDTFNLKPTSVHEALVRLPVNPIFTTNYDDLLEQALRTAKRRFDLVVSSVDTGFWSTDRLQLIKLHGDLSQPESIVITAEDYERYFDDHPALARQLAGALQTRTVLFLGYSATDPDFRQLLTRVRREAGGLARNAFAVLFNAVKLTVKDLERRGIRVINLKVADEPSDEEATRLHRRNQVLTVWLDELHQQVQAEARRLSKRPIIRRQPLPPEPYKFLDFFTSEDTAIFHGRKLDTDRLTSLILTYPLSILYGESGTGKTSLIRAAVLPRLEAEAYSVAYARPLSDPLKTVQEAILGALRDGLVTRPEASSLHALVESSLPVGGRLLIVLDQFEEFFIRQGPETRAHFIHELIDLLNTPEREVRCLLSLRSEYLDRLDELELPLGRDPLRHRMRLHNLGPAGANAAIAEPAAAFGIKLELPLLEQLLTDLEQVGIAPPQLQIVCYVLWQDWQGRGKPKDGLTLKRYLELGGTGVILAGYLDNVIKELEQPEVREEFGLTLDGRVAQEAARVVLKSMITAERTKATVSGWGVTHSEIITRPDVAPAQMEGLLTYLMDKRIIRRLPDSNLYELAHEVMIEKVWEWISEEERHILDLQDMLARATSDYRKFQSLLPPDRLGLLTEHADRLSLDEDTLELVLLSAIEYNMESEVWVSKMHSDGAVEILERLLETSKRTRYPQIAKALGYTRSPKTVHCLENLLRHRSNEVQRSAASALAKLGLPDVVQPLYHAAQREKKLTRAAPIVDALEMLHTEDAASMLMLIASEHKDSRIRSRATNAFLRLHYPKGIRLIVRQLSSGDPMIYQNAVKAVKRILEESPSEFEGMLQDTSLRVRLVAVEALKTISGERAGILLTRALQDENTEVRKQAASALGRLGDKRAVEPLLAMLRDNDAKLRWQAASALGWLGDKRAVEPLLAALRDSDAEVRLSAMRGLGALWELPMLVQLGGGNAKLRREAASALGQLGDERAVEPLLASLQDDEETGVRLSAMSALGTLWELPMLVQLGSESVEVRREAASALGQLGDERAVEPLLAALRDKSDGVRIAAIGALGQLGDERVVEPLLAALWDKSAGVQIAAISALGQLGDERAVEPLLAALEDGDTEVRRRTALALGWLGDIQAVESLIAALRDEDAGVRREAASALGKLGDERTVEPLLATLRDEDAEVRLLATRALGALWELPALVQLGSESAKVRSRAVNILRELGDEWAVRPLLTALRDKDAEVRRGAISALRQLGDERAVEPLLLALQDEDAAVRRAVASALAQLGDVEPLLEMLQDENAVVRKRATSALSSLGDERAVEPLLAALQDEDTEVRGGAISALGQLGDERAVEFLLVALHNGDGEVRWWAALALENLGDERAVEPLLEALRCGDVRLRRRAATALGNLGDKRAVEPLLAALQDEDSKARMSAMAALGALWQLPPLIWLGDANPKKRQQAASALGQLGDERAVEPLLAALQDKRIEVRRQAASALGKLGDPRALAPLLAALQDESVGIRTVAASALGKLGDMRAVEPLLVTLQDKSAAVQAAAASALGELGDERALEPLLAALRDEDPMIRRRAASALGRLGDGRALEPLLAALQDEDSVMRGLAASALGRLGDGRALEPLLAALRDEDPVMRRRTASALGRLGDGRALEPLLAALRDEDPVMRGQAANALGELGDERALEPLLAALRDEDPMIRRRAASALGELGDERALEPLLAALWDEDPVMRGQAANALGELGDERALEPLQVALQDEDAEMQRRAASALGKLGDVRVIEPLRVALLSENLQVRQAAAEALRALEDEVGSHS